MFLKSAFAILLLTASPFLLVVAEETTSAVDCKEFKVFAFRHAEKQKYQDNPSLTETGKERAGRLALILRDKNIEKIYSTNYRRTIETVTPLSESLRIPISPYSPRELKKLAGEIVSSEVNSIVVGHSNTTPDLVKLLSGEDVKPIDESQYQHLFIISFCGNTPTGLEIETSD